MLVTLFCLILGVAGALALIYGGATGVAPVVGPAVRDWVITIPATSVGEVVWSTRTLEVLRLVVFLVCFLTLLALIGEWGEKRVLAFLVLVEVLLVFLAVLLVLTGAGAGWDIRAYYRTTLCLLAAGGADTALALALFMTYYKATGLTTLK